MIKPYSNVFLSDFFVGFFVWFFVGFFAVVDCTAVSYEPALVVL